MIDNIICMQQVFVIETKLKNRKDSNKDEDEEKVENSIIAYILIINNMTNGNVV